MYANIQVTGSNLSSQRVHCESQYSYNRGNILVLRGDGFRAEIAHSETRAFKAGETVPATLLHGETVQVTLSSPIVYTCTRCHAPILDGFCCCADNLRR